MLTRRDQIKLKQDQDQAKTNKQTLENDQDASKPSDDPETENTAGRGRGRGRGRGKAKAKPKGEPKPKATRASKKKPAVNETGDGEKMPEGSPHQVADGPHEAEDDEGPDPHMVTPKRTLFGSDDEGRDAAEDDLMDKSYYQNQNRIFVDQKTGQEITLAEVFENFMPDLWRRKMRRGDDPTPEAKPKAKAKSKAKAQPKRRAKAKAKASAKAKCSPSKPPQLTSPSIKKEQLRRRKRAAMVATTTEEDLTDHTMQGDLIKAVKLVNSFENKDDVKQHLKDAYGSSTEHYNFSPYWTRNAVGLMKKSGSTYAYYNFGSTIGHWNSDMAVVYRAASLTVP